MNHLGIACACLAPLCWSAAVLFYRRSAETVSPAAMTVFKNSVAAVLLAVSALVLGVGFPVDRSATDWARLAASGVLGLAVADTLLFEGLKRIGAARVAIVDTFYSPMLLLFSWWFLDERLSVVFFVGAAFVLAGVLLANLRPASTGEPPSVADTASVRLGTLYAFGAIVGTVIGVILSKPVLEQGHLFEVTLTRMLAGLAAQIPWVLIRGDGPEVFRTFRSPSTWRWLLPAAVIGTYLSLLFWMGGFKWADASVAAVLNQLATVYILVLARFVLHETVGWRQVVGGVSAATGALIIVLGA